MNDKDWILTEDKMPEIIQQIVFWHKNNKRVLVGICMPDGVHVNGYEYKCSHWQPLPKPPKT